MNSTGKTPSEQRTDLTNCDREPIQIPGSIQPHGVLLVLQEPEMRIVQCSANVEEWTGHSVQTVIGSPLNLLCGEETAESLRTGIQQSALDNNPTLLRTISFRGQTGIREFFAIAHRREGILILELESADTETAKAPDLNPLVRSFLARIQHAITLEEITHITAEEVQRLTGFDRTLIYRFDAEWNGTVIAEERNDLLPSYLDLRFPASDIPQQARELYRLNRMRLIANTDYTPVPLTPVQNPMTGKPLDMSFSSLRSVSAIHLEYMRNMGTPASMSVSIVQHDRLWGLISCHHHAPRLLSYPIRDACDFIAQILAMQIAMHQRQEDSNRRIRLQSLQTEMLGYMTAEESFIDGLVNHPQALLTFAQATGAAAVFDDRTALIGDTPSQEQVHQIVGWLAQQPRREVFQTDRMPILLQEADAYRDKCSGLLSISISQLYPYYVLWFRPEVVQTVKWGGDPHKPAEIVNGQTRLNPRKSFEMWKETVRGYSLPFHPTEVEAASEFRNAIIGIVLRRAEEMAALSSELERSNKELEAFSYSVSHDLRAPFRHIVGYAELLKEAYEEALDETGTRYVDTIIDSAHYAGTLVDNLLLFSQMGRASLHFTSFDMNQLVAEIRQEVMDEEAEEREIIWHVAEFPEVCGDVMMLRLAVRNLFSNAVKFTRFRDSAIIEVRVQEAEKEYLFSVKDNGVGFDMEYIDKLFGVFQRLHRMEEFEGTGIGLANVRRIITRHGGRTWAEGKLGQGAIFYFTLPTTQPGGEPC